MQDVLQVVVTMLLGVVALLISITVHEVSHGYAAYKLGDDTAKINGRLSLNPFAHINPVSFGLLVFLMLLSALSGSGSGFVMSVLSVMICFTFANPVPVGGSSLKNPRRDMAIISIAGPLSNIIVAFLAIVLLKYLSYFAISGVIAIKSEFTYNIIYFSLYFLSYTAQLNVGLAMFNLVPIPPLDGSKILYCFLPKKALYVFVKYEKYITLVLALMLIFNLLDAPLNWAGNHVLNGLQFLVGLLPPR